LAVIYDAQGRGIDTNNPLPIKHSASDIIQPVEIQSRYASTIQTHNAVSIAINTWSIESSWHSTDGFDRLACSLIDDANISNGLVVYWSYDGSTIHGQDTVIAISAKQTGSGITDVKAPYFKISLGNTDTVAAHTMSAWVYLKA
jgi:hypothetical protein